MSEIQKILSQVGASTLEQLAFLFSFPEDHDRPLRQDGAVGCRVRFSGPASGEMLLAISSAVLPELAANMLGAEDEDDVDPAHLIDALRETGNIVCGNALPAIYGSEAVFDLEAPEFISEEMFGDCFRAFTDSPETTQSRIMSLDEGECQLFLKICDQ